ncbi:MAG TPA: hypothetical protein VGA32_00130, partial [Anaerolineales bacterium]|jgi:uncharacterized membrane protein YkvA (DUF1232 family)
MTDRPPRSVVPGGGVFREISTRLKLIMRLMGDRRVPFLLKLMPVASLVYLVFPDLAPGFLLDDAAILGLGGYLFVELCPAHVVKEHLDALTSVVDADWREAPPEKKGDDQIGSGGQP